MESNGDMKLSKEELINKNFHLLIQNYYLRKQLKMKKTERKNHLMNNMFLNLKLIEKYSN